MPDLTKIVFHSQYPAFKNNRIYTGTLTISGSTNAGSNTRTFTVTLDKAPDLIDVVFNGPTDTVYNSDPRPSTAWFKVGAVWTPTSGFGTPAPWTINYRINGLTVVITANYVQQFTGSETITSTDFNYRIVDYSEL